MKEVSEIEIWAMGMALRLALEAFPTIALESLERGDEEAIYTIRTYARLALKNRKMAEAASDN